MVQLQMASSKWIFGSLERRHCPCTRRASSLIRESQHRKKQQRTCCVLLALLLVTCSLFYQVSNSLSLAFQDYLPLARVDPSIFPGPFGASDFYMQDKIELPNVFHGCGNTSRHVDGIQLHVIGWRRANQLKRLLTLLKDADYVGWHKNIPLYLHIDGEHSDEVASIVSSFHWPHGSKIVDKKETRLGLREMWLDSLGKVSKISGNNTLLVALEDDVIVSPSYFQWLLAVIDRYSRNPKCRDSQLVGFSLSPVVFQEMFYPYQSWNVQDVMGDLEHGAYLSAVPSSWGAAYWSDHWQEFDNFVRIRMRQPFYNLSLELSPSHLNIPDGASSNSWPNSWKRFMVDFMYGRGLVMLYPNLRHQKGLATALQQDGEHADRDIWFPLLASVNPVVSDLVEHYYIAEERELPMYGHLIVVGLDHKKSSKEHLAALGTKFLQSIANTCKNCRPLLNVWAKNEWWQIQGETNQPFICIADIYTSINGMGLKPVQKYGELEKFLFFKPKQKEIANQLLAIIKAHGWARAMGRTLVAPPIIFQDSIQDNWRYNETSWVAFNSFFRISQDALRNWTSSRHQLLHSYWKGPVDFINFPMNKISPWRSLRGIHHNISSVSLQTKDPFVPIREVEHVDLTRIFDQLGSIRMLQHLFGGCDDELLMLDGILSHEETADLWNAVQLPDGVKLNPEIANVISKVNTKFQFEMGNYTCCHERLGIITVTCNTEHHATPGRKRSNKNSYVAPFNHQKVGMCPISANQLVKKLSSHVGRPLIYFSGNPTVGIKKVVSEITLKSYTSSWVSEELKNLTGFRGKDYDLISMLADQQLCKQAKVAIL